MARPDAQTTHLTAGCTSPIVDIGPSHIGGAMKYVLFSMFVTVSAIGCSADGRATHIRSARQFGPASDPASIEERGIPPRIRSCLALGRERLGGLTATAEIATFDLGALSCGDCRIRISLVVPPLWRRPVDEESGYSIYDLRVGVVYGRFTLRAPSNAVLVRLRDDCPKWAAIPSYAEQACAWRETEKDVWRSGFVAVLPQRNKAGFAAVKLGEETMTGEPWQKPETLVNFSQDMTLDAAVAIEADLIVPTIVSGILRLSGEVGFVPIAVETVERSSGSLLGCMPVSAG
jgi:hypothetical protein